MRDRGAHRYAPHDFRGFYGHHHIDGFSHYFGNVGAVFWTDIIMLKRLSIIVLLLLSPWAYAEDYYWTVPYPQGGTKYPSLSAACAANNNFYKSQHPDKVFVSSSINGNTCRTRLKIVHPPSSIHPNGYETFHHYSNAATGPLGDGCPSGKVYNAEKGQCDIEGLKTPEQCAAQSGQVAFEAEGSNTWVNTCVLGCHAKSAINICGSGECNTTSVVYSGGYCDGGDHDEPPALDPDYPDPDPDPDPDPPLPDPDPLPPDPPPGNGEDNGGSSGGGSDNGSGNGGGEGGGSGGNGGSEGDGGGGSGGGNGSGGGSGGGSGNGGGNGNSSGGGGSGGNGEGEGGGSASGTCSAQASNVQCEGDAVLCAIYQEQFKSNCALEAVLSEQGVNTGVDYATTLTQDDKPSEETIDVADFFDKAISKGRWMPTQCVPDDAFTALGKSLSLSWQPVCDMASYLAPLIVFVASMFFAVIVTKALRS